MLDALDVHEQVFSNPYDSPVKARSKGSDVLCPAVNPKWADHGLRL
jgi:hypothetical protein